MMDACLTHVHELLGVPLLWKMFAYLMCLMFCWEAANVLRTSECFGTFRLPVFLRWNPQITFFLVSSFRVGGKVKLEAISR